MGFSQSSTTGWNIPLIEGDWTAEFDVQKLIETSLQSPDAPSASQDSSFKTVTAQDCDSLSDSNRWEERENEWREFYDAATSKFFEHDTPDSELTEEELLLKDKLRLPNGRLVPLTSCSDALCLTCPCYRETQT